MSDCTPLVLPERDSATWLCHFPRAADLAPSVAEFLIQRAFEAVEDHGAFVLGISGGSTPLELFSLLAQPQWHPRLPWDKMALFWVDERWVAYGREDSNFGQFRRRFLNQAPHGPAGMYPMPVSGCHPAADTQAYAAVLERFFGPGPLPVFDCLLLGLGHDGHTASLFPHSPLLQEQNHWVVTVPPSVAAVPNLPRLSLSLPVLNKAKNIAFLVSGERKAAITTEVLHSRPDPRLPATLVRPDGELYWFAAGMDFSSDLQESVEQR
ncbi:6-phosphogluconolactonase [Desulfohalobium retbaense]|uniref:6-phosphogluconolactonase n=1 Tax=Desulfohalobium retbaense (strain ATCC 49708 / DSM 5692 / JCM 16813 / HR100) TaxID=485915 RepID=C8X5S3_DESRD|nr:6-phosphogluconolactonase [Desulfohalobium retbaense]ACV69770.1 6-phosphogluconolactonase [Desulfohalobium retbaense DSM 5692]